MIQPGESRGPSPSPPESRQPDQRAPACEPQPVVLACPQSCRSRAPGDRPATTDRVMASEEPGATGKTSARRSGGLRRAFVPDCEPRSCLGSDVADFDDL